MQPHNHNLIYQKSDNDAACVRVCKQDRALGRDRNLSMCRHHCVAHYTSLSLSIFLLFSFSFLSPLYSLSHFLPNNQPPKLPVTNKQLHKPHTLLQQFTDFRLISAATTWWGATLVQPPNNWKGMERGAVRVCVRVGACGCVHQPKPNIYK